MRRRTRNWSGKHLRTQKPKNENMKYSPKQYATALHQAIFESEPADQDKILDNFVNVLRLSGDVGRIEEIEKEFYNYEREIRGIKEAQVTSSRALSQTEEKNIIEELNAMIGGRVELKKKVDEGLVGGVVIKVGDTLIDGSVKKTLKDLKEELQK